VNDKIDNLPMKKEPEPYLETWVFDTWPVRTTCIATSLKKERKKAQNSLLLPLPQHNISLKTLI